MNPSYRAGKGKARPQVVIPKGAEQAQSITSPITENKSMGEGKGKMQPKEKFKLKNDKKHHPHPAKEVPYPVNYERQVIDKSVYCSKHCFSFRDSLLYPFFAVIFGSTCG